MATKEKAKIITAAEATPRKFVDESKNYRAVIQLGPSKSWRNCRRGRWVRDEELDERGPRGKSQEGWRAEPALRETGPISGRVLNGLIQHHNDWIEMNREKQDVRGQMNRQLLVVSYTETPELPPETPMGGPGAMVNQLMPLFRTLIREEMNNSSTRSSTK